MPAASCCLGPCQRTQAIPTAHISSRSGAFCGTSINRQRYHYFFCCFDFDRTTLRCSPTGTGPTPPAYLRAMMQGFIERLYPYTGDPDTIVFLQDFIDYELENGLTPENYAWSRVPYTSANPGDHRYTGWSHHGEDYIEPHVVGEDGYAYLRFYEMTGNTKYLQAAIRCADALVKNYKPGDAAQLALAGSLLRARRQDRAAAGMGPYSANVVEPIMLFDELIRLEQGDVAAYRRVRQAAWEWLHKYPMKNNVWVGYFEDVPPRMENMNQVIPLEYARYVLLNPEKDLEWRDHARQADRVGQDHAEVAQVHRPRRHRHHRAGRREELLLWRSERVLRQSYLAPRRSRGAVLCEDRTTRLIKRRRFVPSTG